MNKYRLTWQGDGSLDLSQVLDDRGVPVVLTKKGAGVTVDAITYQHPLVQHYLKSGLQGAPLGASPPPLPLPPPPLPPVAQATPTSPPAPKPTPPLTPPEPSKTEPPKIESIKISLNDKTPINEIPVKVTSVEEESKANTDEDAPLSDKPKSPRRTTKRRSSRGK